MKIVDSVYWDGGGSFGDKVSRGDNGKVYSDVGIEMVAEMLVCEVNRGDNGKVYSDVGIEVGSGEFEEVLL